MNIGHSTQLLMRRFAMLPSQFQQNCFEQNLLYAAEMVGACSAVSVAQVEMEEKRNLPVWGRKRERKKEREIDAARDNCFPHSESQ